MLIEQYFLHLQAELENSAVVDEWAMEPERRGRTQGFLRVDVILTNGTLLHFREYVDVAQAVQRLTYAYQYMTQDRSLIFRYDNTDHHPHIATHPHHKHDGSEENVVKPPHKQRLH